MASDEEIRKKIVDFLYKAYRNPKGRFQHVTLNTLIHEVKKTINCEKEDIKREVEYLKGNGWIRIETKSIKAYKIGNTSFPSYKSYYYHLDIKTINEIEGNSAYVRTPSFTPFSSTINISNSLVNAPVTSGGNNIIFSATNTTNDINKILNIIKNRKGIDSKTKNYLSNLIKNDLPEILESGDYTKAVSLKEKVISFRQNWLVPIIAQIVATYIAHKLGINV